MAGALGAVWVDLDVLIERRAKKEVARIFAEDGEAAFRALEAELGGEVLAGEPVVLTPGGGFALDPALRRRAGAAGLVIYLETAPEVAAARVAAERHRPLLEGPDRALRMRQLLGAREAAYLEAEEKVTTDSRAPSEVARGIVELARAKGGW